jgi:AcrR family transcriptional regulator
VREPAKARTDGRVERGDRTRQAIVRRSADIASVEGLDGVSIGRLAADLSISKGGLFAHFGSKEELQLATIAAARELFRESVVVPALQQDRGLVRLWALGESWLGYSQGRVFPGGCFFARTAGEFAARTGKVHEVLVTANREWIGLIEDLVVAAQRCGHLDGSVEPAQLAFELNAFYEAANLGSWLDPAPGESYLRTRRAVRTVLARNSTPDAPPIPAPSTAAVDLLRTDIIGQEADTELRAQLPETERSGHST